MAINRTKRYKNIVWDWNGTILDDIDVSVETINEVLLRNSLETISKERYKEIFGFPVKTYYEQIGFDFDRLHDWEEVSVDFISTYRSLAIDLSLTSSVKSVLKQLHERGYRLYVLSALEETILKQMLKDYEIDNLFDHIYGCDNIYAQGKVERGRQLLSEQQLLGRDTLMIGDTLHDAEVAEDLGFDWLLYTGGHNSRARLQQKSIVIDDMRELLDVCK